MLEELKKFKESALVYYVCKLLSLLSIFLLAVAIYALVIDENPIVCISFILPSIWTLVLWMQVMHNPPPQKMRLRTSLKIAAVGWLALSLFGGLPYFIAGYLSPIDAWFESMSGFTATGLSMFADVESLPGSILLWRSLTEWIGGVGIIVLFLSVLYKTGTVFQNLYAAEGRTDKIAPTIIGTSRRIWGIYSFYTLLAIFVLWILSVPLFDAVNISMTTLATGGFSVTNNSIAAYPTYIGIALIPFMMLGGISFVAHMKLFRGKIKEFFTLEVIVMFVILLLSSSFLLFFMDAYTSVFQTTSALTGTGFTTTNIADWGEQSKFMLTILMVFGGGFGSTASALKIIRVIVLFYGIVWVVKKRLYPQSAVIPFKIGKKVFDDSGIRDVAIYTTAYLTILILGAMFFMCMGFSVADSLFEVASAEGNVGLSVGITSSTMHIVGKFILIIEMWVGRLEIIPVLVLLFSPLRKH